MTSAKLKRYPPPLMYPPLLPLTQHCVGILAINWVMQGMRGMDRKELGFRILLESVLSIALGLALAPTMGGFQNASTLAALAAHTFGFLANGQFWVCARYCPLYRRSPEAIDASLRRISAQLQACHWLEYALCIGSCGRGDRARGTRSDIDLRLVFPKGFRGWVRTNLLLLRLRTIAFLEAVPLDLYAYDSPRSLERFDADEPWLVILDRQGLLRRTFPARQMTEWTA